MCGRYEYHPGEFSDLRIRFNLYKDLPEFIRAMIRPPALRPASWQRSCAGSASAKTLPSGGSKTFIPPQHRHKSPIFSFHKASTTSGKGKVRASAIGRINSDGGRCFPSSQSLTVSSETPSRCAKGGRVSSPAVNHTFLYLYPRDR
jgi:hypothetical protein